MTLVTLDVVLLLPPAQRALAITLSQSLAATMENGGGAAFRLGDPFPGRPHGGCEPHVSLFMMAVEEEEVAGVADAVAGAARWARPVSGRATDYRHNHEGAPEVLFAISDEFRDVQRAVIAAAEPLRRGRLREFGPGGERLSEIVDAPDPPDSVRVSQLRRYDFDDVSDRSDDRFRPHVTLTWPRDETSRVDLTALPPAAGFDASLTDIGLYGMGPTEPVRSAMGPGR